LLPQKLIAPHGLTICKILAEEAPDPKSLALLLEPLSLGPDADTEAFLTTSLAWAKEHLAHYLR